MSQSATNVKSKTIKITIAVLAVLIVLTAGALIARIIYLNQNAKTTATTVVPNNTIGQESSDSTQSSSSNISPNNQQTNPINSGEKTTIQLYKSSPNANQKFSVTNLLPGDQISKQFAVAVNHHSNVTLLFGTKVTAQTNELANVLTITVINQTSNQVLYQGPFVNLPESGLGQTLLKQTQNPTTVEYSIQVSMPTSASNQYQLSHLTADFCWWVDDSNALDSPQTGDAANLALWIVLLTASFTLVIILLLLRRNPTQEEDPYAN